MVQRTVAGALGDGQVRRYSLEPAVECPKVQPRSFAPVGDAPRDRRTASASRLAHIGDDDAAS